MSASPEIELAGLPDGRLRLVLEGFFGRFLEDDEMAEAVEETLREVGYWNDEDLADVFTWAHLVLGARARVAPREEFNALVNDVGMGREEAAGLVGVPNLEVVRSTALVPVSRGTDASDEDAGTGRLDATAAAADEGDSIEAASDPIPLGSGASDDVAPVTLTEPAPVGDDPTRFVHEPATADALRDLTAESGLEAMLRHEVTPGVGEEAAATSDVDDGDDVEATVDHGDDESSPSGPSDDIDDDIDPEDDPWALDPLPRQSLDPVEDDPDREPVWHMTRDGWMSAESVGTTLREGFATEDLESERWSRTRRLVVGAATFATSAVVVAAVSIL